MQPLLSALSLPLWLAIAVVVVLVILGVALYRRVQRPAPRPPVRFGGGAQSAPDDQSRPRTRPSQQ